MLLFASAAKLSSMARNRLRAGVSHYSVVALPESACVQVSVTILWWPYLKASLFTPIKQLRGRALVFKSTAKGSGGAASAGFRTLGPSALLVLINIICIIVGLVTFDAAVNAPQVIALCWCIPLLYVINIRAEVP